jgi:S1-C subfamily serine protease
MRRFFHALLICAATVGAASGTLVSAPVEASDGFFGLIKVPALGASVAGLGGGAGAGVRVAQLDANSPLLNAVIMGPGGIPAGTYTAEVGDLIVSVNGAAVNTPAALLNIMSSVPFGSTVNINIRDKNSGQLYTIIVQV